MIETAAVLATARFGFAARGGDLAAAAADPRGWVLHQLGGHPALLASRDLPPSSRSVAALLQARRARRESGADLKPFREEMRALYLREVGGRLDAAIASEMPLLER